MNVIYVSKIYMLSVRFVHLQIVGCCYHKVVVTEVKFNLYSKTSCI